MSLLLSQRRDAVHCFVDMKNQLHSQGDRGGREDCPCGSEKHAASCSNVEMQDYPQAIAKVGREIELNLDGSMRIDNISR